MGSWGAMPGWPGPVFAGRRSLVSPVLPPFMPGQPAGGAPGQGPAPGPSPFEGLARAGVPISLTPDGRPVLGMGGAVSPGGFPMPPAIAGMPQIPAPPDWMTAGDPQGGGLFKPLPAVSPVAQHVVG